MKRTILTAALACAAAVIHAVSADDPQEPFVDGGPPTLWTNPNFTPILDPSEFETDSEEEGYPDGVLDDDQWEEDVDEEGPALRDADAEALNEFQPMSEIDQIID